jgi:hypothetical protein
MRQHKAGVRVLAMVFVALALGIAAALAGAAATQDVWRRSARRSS